MTPGPVLLIDSHSVLFRAHWALPAMNTAAGEPTAALYGTCVLLLKLLREQAPADIAFAVDTPRPSFRRERYPAYKGTRGAVPSDLTGQLLRFGDIPAALGAPVHAAPGYEADDVLATLAARAAAAGRRARIVTGDRDLLQLAAESDEAVSGRGPGQPAPGSIDILFIGRRGQDHVLYAAADVEARFGVPPAMLPALIGLCGDSSDNLPGTPGVGTKTAARWLREHGSAGGVVAAAAALEPARLRRVVAERGEQIVANEALATLVRDLPIADPAWSPLAAPGLVALRSVFERFEFKSLLPRLDALISSRAGEAEPTRSS